MKNKGRIYNQDGVEILETGRIYLFSTEELKNTNIKIKLLFKDDLTDETN